jgi:hypothetical protein
LHALSLEHGRAHLRRFLLTVCARRRLSPWRCCRIPQCYSGRTVQAIDPVTAKIMRLLQSVARHGVRCSSRRTSFQWWNACAHQIVMIRKGTKVWDSPVTELPQSLEDHYFDLVETPVVEELEWLGPARS